MESPTLFKSYYNGPTLGLAVEKDSVLFLEQNVDERLQVHSCGTLTTQCPFCKAFQIALRKHRHFVNVDNPCYNREDYHTGTGCIISQTLRHVSRSVIVITVVPVW